MYLGQREDAGAGGHSQLLLKVLGVGPGLLERQPRHEAVYRQMTHPQGLLHALLERPTHGHHLQPGRDRITCLKVIKSDRRMKDLSLKFVFYSTSPTLFMALPISCDMPWKRSRSQRGILVTM